MAALPFAVIPTPLGTVTSGNETAAKPASHLGEFKHIGMTWATSSGAPPADIWARGDFGEAKLIDHMALLKAVATDTTTFRLRLGDTQAEVDGVAPYDSGVQTLADPLPDDDDVKPVDGLYHAHWSLPSVESRRWWRIDIADAALTVPFEASILVLGKRLAPANYYSPGFEFGLEDLGDVEIGRWGVPDETPGLIFRRLALRFGYMSEEDYERKFRHLLQRLGKREVALWCFDPEATQYRREKTYFGWLRQAPFATGGNIKPGRYELELEILSMI